MFGSCVTFVLKAPGLDLAAEAVVDVLAAEADLGARGLVHVDADLTHAAVHVHVAHVQTARARGESRGLAASLQGSPRASPDPSPNKRFVLQYLQNLSIFTVGYDKII